jgi:hypothetical protein
MQVWEFVAKADLEIDLADPKDGKAWLRQQPWLLSNWAMWLPEGVVTGARPDWTTATCKRWTTGVHAFRSLVSRIGTGKIRETDIRAEDSDRLFREYLSYFTPFPRHRHGTAPGESLFPPVKSEHVPAKFRRIKMPGIKYPMLPFSKLPVFTRENFGGLGLELPMQTKHPELDVSGMEVVTFWAITFGSFIGTDLQAVCEECGMPLPPTKKWNRPSRQKVCLDCRRKASLNRKTPEERRKRETEKKRRQRARNKEA